jgi:uncharacterized protein YutE (UPF0331/DUF86 family)
MTDRVLVLRRLARLLDALATARQRRPPEVATLRADGLLRDALALSVLVAVQEAADIAFHVVSDEKWGVPVSYAESFELLARHGVLDAEVAKAMTGATGLRNRIAHAYATLDVDRFWAELPGGLDAMDRFAQAMARHVGPG